MNFEREKRLLAPAESDLKELVERLNRESCSGAPDTRRSYDRYLYRAGVVPYVCFRADGAQHRSVVFPRNISPEGLACLHRGYIHTGAEIHFVLPRHMGEPVIVRGHIRWCRHVSKLLHEMGVQFIDTINPADFCDPSVIEAYLAAAHVEAVLPEVSGNVLVITPDREEQQLLMSGLETTGVNLTCCTYIGAGIDALKTSEFDAIICVDDLAEIPADQIVPALRAEAPGIPILTLTWTHESSDRSNLASNDQLAYVQRPVDPLAIAAMLSALLPDDNPSDDQSSPADEASSESMDEHEADDLAA